MKKSPLLYLMIYISLIPIFAIWYNFMPDEFYHSTNKYEKYLENDRNEIEKELGKTIRENLLLYHHGRVFAKDSSFFEISTATVSNVFINNEELYFFFEGQYFDKNNKLRSSFGARLILPNYDFERIDTYWHKQVGTISYVYIEDYFGKLPISFDEIFVFSFWKDVRDYGGSNPPSRERNIIDPDKFGRFGGRTFLPISLIKKISAYRNSLNGFPSHSTGNLERMLYLSAMVITTTGPGDILPISKRARLIVTFESILGIVVIGLFLNSLAIRIKTKG